MTHLGFGAVNVMDFHSFTRGSTCHLVDFWFASFNIVCVHLVSDEFGRRCSSNFNFRNLIVRIQGVIALPLRLELHDLRRCSLNVICFQVRFLFVKAYVERTWARSVNVPVLVREFSFINFLRTMQFGSRT